MRRRSNDGRWFSQGSGTGTTPTVEPPSGVLRRTCMDRALSTAAIAALLFTTGCGAGAERDGRRVGPVQYGITYPVGVEQYDQDASQPAFETCADLPGASFAGSADSLPPGLSVRFEGSKSQQDELESCLRALPDTRRSGPHVLPDGF